MIPTQRIEPPKITSYVREEFLRMYKELTDDDFIEQSRRKTERIKRKEDKMADTGAYERPKHRTVY